MGVGRNHDLSWVARSWVPPRFLFIASDWERKNGEMVLSAFKRLLEDIPEAHLDLVGHVPDIEEANIASHGYLSLADPSQRARLNPLFERATCLLIPSLHEPLGISIVEAGASGVPSIGSIHGGSREAIGPGGVVIDPRDLDQLTNAMLRFSDPDVAREAGMRAWERSKLYTWTAVADRLLQALNIRERQNSTFSRL